jgi:geranylgeranyl diphosphate synthase type 3
MESKTFFSINKMNVKNFFRINKLINMKSQNRNNFTTYTNIKRNSYYISLNCFKNNNKIQIYNKNFQNINYKKFSNNKSFIEDDDRIILNDFKNKIDSYENILEEIFMKKFSNRDDFINYFNFNNITKNISIEDSIPLDSVKKSILDPCWDMINRGGKRWRPILGLMISDLFNVDLEASNYNDEEKKLYFKLLYLVEILHNSSLILDDVEDKSEQRRNKPCVHLIYGEAIAINAGISLMFFPFHNILSKIEDPNLVCDLSKCYFEELSAIHLGQGWDIEMKISSRVPGIMTYKDTVLMKTGVFPRLIVKFLRILIKKSFIKNNNINDDKSNKNGLILIDEIFSTLLNIVDNMSISFQIKDDLLNITDCDLSKRKGFFGEDIFEGKLTLMILHTLNLQHQDNNTIKNIKRLREILAMNTKNPQLIKEAVDILVKNGSIKFSEEIMNNHVDVSIDLCNQLMSKISLADEEGNIFNINSIRNIKLLLFYLIDRKI